MGGKGRVDGTSAGKATGAGGDPPGEGDASVCREAELTCPGVLVAKRSTDGAPPVWTPGAAAGNTCAPGVVAPSVDVLAMTCEGAGAAQPEALGGMSVLATTCDGAGAAQPEVPGGVDVLATTCNGAGAARPDALGPSGVPEKKGVPTGGGALVSSSSRKSKCDEGGAEPSSAKGKDDSSKTT